MSGLIALPPLTPWNLLWALGALAGTGLVALLVAAAGAYVYYKVVRARRRSGWTRGWPWGLTTLGRIASAACLS